MKLAIFRSVFLCGALALTSLAVSAWQEPGTGVYSVENGGGQCLMKAPTVAQQLQPDQDLLLLMFSLSQGLGNRS